MVNVLNVANSIEDGIIPLKKFADYGLNDILSSLDELLVDSEVKAEEKSRENMHLTGTENTALRRQSGQFRRGF